MDLQELAIKITVFAEGAQEAIDDVKSRIAELENAVKGQTVSAEKSTESIVKSYEKQSNAAVDASKKEVEAVQSATSQIKIALGEREAAFKATYDKAIAEAERARSLQIEGASAERYRGLAKADRLQLINPAEAEKVATAAEAAYGKAVAAAEKAYAKATAAAEREYAKQKAAADKSYKAQASEAEKAAKQSGAAIKKSTAEQAAAYAIVAAAAIKAYKSIISYIQSSAKALNDYTISMQGLESAAERQGIASSKVVKTLSDVTDEIVGATDAGVALRHLMDRGFNADQAAQILNRFKESAALSRRENVGLADSIKAAAEATEYGNARGLKAIGIMKSQSEMWEDYAKSVGLSVSDLTESMKLQAEYQGFLDATAGKVGDYAKHQETLAASQERTAQTSEQLAITFGDTMAPTVQLANEVTSGLLGTFNALTGACPPLAAGVTTATVAILGLVAVKKAVDTMKALGIGVTGLTSALGLASGPMIAIVAAVGIATAAWTKHKNNVEAAAEAEKKAATERDEAIQQATANARQLSALAGRYDELTSKTRLTYREAKELKSIEEQLSSQHGDTGGAVSVLAGEYGDLASAIRAASDEEFALAQKLLTGKIDENSDKVESLTTRYNILNASIEAGRKHLAAGELTEADIKSLDDLVTQFDEVSERLKASSKEWISGSLEYSTNEAIRSGTPREVAEKISSELMSYFDQMISADDFDPLSGVTESFERSIPRIMSALSSIPGFTQAESVFSEMKQKIIDGVRITAADEAKIIASVDTLTNMPGLIYQELIDGGIPEEQANKWAEAVTQMILGPFKEGLIATGLISETIADLNKEMVENMLAGVQESLAVDQKTVFDKLKSGVDSVSSAMKEAQSEAIGYGNAIQALERLQALFAEPGINAKELWDSEPVQALVQQIREAGVSLNYYSEIQDSLIAATGLLEGAESKLYGVVRSSYQEQKTEIENIISGIVDEIDAKKASVDATEEEIKALENMKFAAEALLGVLEANAQASMNIAPPTIAFDPLTASAKQYQQQVDKISASAKELQKRSTALKEPFKVFQDAAKTLKTAKVGTDAYNSALKVLGLTAGATKEDIKNAAESMGESYDAAFSDITDGGKDLEKQLLDLIVLANMRAGIEIDTEAAAADIRALINEGLTAEEILDKLGVLGSGRKGGGGGKKDTWYQQQIKEMEHLRKLNQLTYEEELAYLERINAQRGRLKKDEQIDLEERLYQAREDVRQKAIDDDYATLEHRKAMNQITLQEELAFLEQMRQAHAMNAEELLEIEEKIYAVRRSLVQADYSAIEHSKAMGELTLQQELAAVEAIRAAHELSAEEQIAWDERVYQLKQDIRRKAIDDAYADLEHEKAMGRLSYQQEVEWLERIRDAHQMTAEEQRQIEEELYSAREAFRQALLQGDYSALEHRKRMGELTLEQELETLQAIKAAREMNAEELLDIEEKLYAQTQSIRNRDAQSITSLANSLTKALSERYKEMRDAEIELLTASKDSWKDWADENVKGIQAQIDALDALLKKEDTEAQDAKELKQIAKLREQITFEQDEYNRRQLQAQLDKAIADREARLRRESIEAEKDALKSQIDVINEQAKAEQNALDTQIAEIKKNYEERLNAQSLQAEAERLILSGNQDAILSLLADYAPDYNATGKTLGEALLDGFTVAVGSVVEWFDDFNAQMAATQENIKRMALDASDAFNKAYQAERSRQTEVFAQAGGKQISINQTVNFNQPVESAYDAAQRVREANEELAKTLL